MTKEELLQLFDDFINEQGDYTEFISFIEGKGYSEAEYEKAIGIA